MNTCNVCGLEVCTGIEGCCSHCMMCKYCSFKCQRAVWHVHKTDCFYRYHVLERNLATCPFTNYFSSSYIVLEKESRGLNRGKWYMISTSEMTNALWDLQHLHCKFRTGARDPERFALRVGRVSG